MPLSRSRDYLSIGEVLELLRAEYPDISISKIRFLESEGLIAPERTPSGYRKYFDPEVARLRYILSLQRDHFMPLKVIRDRLAGADSNGGAMPESPASPAPEEGARPRSGKSSPEPDLTGLQMSRTELMSASSLSDAQLKGLEDFGLIDGASATFDENDLAVAKASRRFFQFGVEPRHLRMYRQFADREASFFEQIVSPVARKRDPDGQREAARSLQELVALSRQLHDGTLRARTRELM